MKSLQTRTTTDAKWWQKLTWPIGPGELKRGNDDWVVICQVCYFFADRISKMAATRQLSLPLDPMGISLKNFFVRNYSTNLIFCIIRMFLDNPVIISIM
jgi:hypothetical protein